MARTFLWLLVGTLLGAAACGRTASAPAGPGPFSLHCDSRETDPLCIRFHAETGTGTRVDLRRLSPASPPAEGSGPFAVTCGRWSPLSTDGSPGQAPTRSLCLRLDTRSGVIQYIDTAGLATAL